MAGKADNPESPREKGAAEVPSDSSRRRAGTALSGYLRWVENLPGRLAFRGHASAAWLLESSALRRLNKGRPLSPGMAGYVFTGYLDDIVNKIRVRFPEYGQLSDLEIMAHLQHQGGATGLIDFTESSLVALYFACQPTEGGLSPDLPDGRVFAVPLDGKGMSEVRKKEVLRRNVDYFFPVRASGKLWFWTPNHDHRRMLMQQSLFVFGQPSMDGVAGVKSHDIPAAVKPALLRLLETMGVSEKTLFSDFPGFADANACGQEYSARSAESYYTDNIERDPKSPNPYFRRGIFRRSIQNYKGAIADYTRVIELKPQYAKAHNNRGNSYRHLGRHAEAIEDYTRAIELKPQYAKAHNSRGNAYSALGRHAEAIADWKEAKRLGEQTGDMETVQSATANLAKHGKPK